ncbi:MAG: hypothetical protein ACR2PT_23690 [Endozoicomonas sp.]
MYGELNTWLYRAFNVPGEVMSRSPLDDRVRGGGQNRLLPAEWAAQGSQVRALLERELPDSDYRILKCFYTEPGDLESLLLDMDPLQEGILKAAKIYAEVHPQFLQLCCASAFWNCNLFRDRRYGPMQKYVLPGKTRFLLGQRKKRVKQALEAMREEAMAKAEPLLVEERHMKSNIKKVI